MVQPYSLDTEIIVSLQAVALRKLFCAAHGGREATPGTFELADWTDTQPALQPPKPDPFKVLTQDEIDATVKLVLAARAEDAAK